MCLLKCLPIMVQIVSELGRSTISCRRLPLVNTRSERDGDVPCSNLTVVSLIIFLTLNVSYFAIYIYMCYWKFSVPHLMVSVPLLSLPMLFPVPSLFSVTNLFFG